MLFILKNQFYAKYLSSDIYRLIFLYWPGCKCRSLSCYFIIIILQIGFNV